MPNVQKMLELKGVNKKQIQAKIKEKMNQANDKHRNRSNVGTVIKMHELIKPGSKDHIENHLKTRLALEKDSYFRKI